MQPELFLELVGSCSSGNDFALNSLQDPISVQNYQNEVFDELEHKPTSKADNVS